MRTDEGFRVRESAPGPSLGLRERLLAACDTATFGRELVRIGVRLRRPSAIDAELDEAVRVWLARDPPDDGRPVAWPRVRR